MKTYKASFTMFGGNTHYEMFRAPDLITAINMANEWGKKNEMVFSGIHREE